MLSRFHLLRRAAVVAVLFLICLKLSGPVRSESLLTIGSPAPALNISDWIQQGQGKYPKVNQFEVGKVYVVEFWATWCGPCIQSMPHLAKLQEEYADRQVQIISVSDEPVDEIREFLKRQAGTKQGEAITFEQLTSAYSLTTDPDGSTQNDYTLAAKQNGIPCAFIVGKDSKIEWIGHPMRMDQPLLQVVEDRWDREAFAREFKEERDLESLKEQLAALLQDPNDKEPTPRKIEMAIDLVKGFLARIKSSSVRGQTQFLLFDLLVQFRPETQETADVGRAIFDQFSSRPIELNSLTWGIYEFANAGHIKNPKLIEEALKATQTALGKVEPAQRGTVLDTIARLQYLSGDVKGAISSAKEAVKAPDATPDVQAFIDKLEAEVKSQAK